MKWTSTRFSELVGPAGVHEKLYNWLAISWTDYGNLELADDFFRLDGPLVLNDNDNISFLLIYWPT